MASRSICFSVTLVWILKNNEKARKTNNLLRFGAFESINIWRCLEQILINFGYILAPLLLYASRGLKITSRLLQAGLIQPIWAPLEPKLAPSWLKLGPCWAQVGSNLAQVGPMLGSFRGPQPPLGQPKPFQIPSCCLLASHTPTCGLQEPK